MATYYYPSAYGAAEFTSGSVSTDGTKTFTANSQATAGSYSVVTPLGNTGPGGALQYSVTIGYTGPGTGTTITTTQTRFSDANHNETYGYFPVTSGGTTTLYPAYFILTNGPISTSYTYTFASAGSDASTQFTLTGGSTTDPTVCFVSGTLIRTAIGDVAVEKLAVGDRCVTAAGSYRTIRWIGHRHIDCRAHPRRFEVHPVRITAHAFGAEMPQRTLYLSPGHPVLVGANEDGEGGHLVPIMCLVNGTTIERVEVDEVTYWHIEFDQHDILLAEGLPAESYIDLGSRPWFAAADGALYDPDMALPDMPGRCRPVAIGGPVVEAERRRLDTVFATRLKEACAWPDEFSALRLAPSL